VAKGLLIVARFSHIPLRKKRKVAAALKGIFGQSEVEAARTHLAAFKLRYERDYPEAVKCLGEDQIACLTYYQFPLEMQKHIRTSNATPGLFSTIRRRTNSMGVFQNEGSCMLIMYAVIKSVKFQRIPVG